MPADLSDASDLAILDIMNHLRKGNDGDWNDVKARHTNISTRTFWRLVAKAREMPVVRGSEVARAVKAASEISIMCAAEAISSPPSVLVKKKSEDTVDLMATLRELLADAELIREWSMSKPDADGNRTIRNPMFFAKQAQIRRELVDTIGRCYEKVAELQNMQRHWNIILDEIAAVSPEAHENIMRRFQILNAERGVALGT